MLAYATVTQKGQITLIKKFRDMLGINPYDKVVVESFEDCIKIKRVPNFFEVTEKLGKKLDGKKFIDPRVEMEKDYIRI